MSDCCSSENTKVGSLKESLVCPDCHQKGKPVDIILLKSLLVSEAMKRLDSVGNYYFCRAESCLTVYFNSSAVFSKKDLTVPVFQKEKDCLAPVCYCFGYNRQQLRDDVIKNGKSIIAQKIKIYTKDKKCACEIRNPQGSCCLGNVAQVVKSAKEN